MSNCYLPLEYRRCLGLKTGEETGCCKMIIEKKVGGPLWPSGSAIIRPLCFLVEGDGGGRGDYRMLYL